MEVLIEIGVVARFVDMGTRGAIGGDRGGDIST